MAIGRSDRMKLHSLRRLPVHAYRGAVPGTLALLLALPLLALGCSQQDPMEPKAFAKPEDALRAMGQAFETDDPDALLTILGKRYADRIVTPDWEAESPARRRIAEAAQEKLVLEKVSDGVIELVIGQEDWPFPIPLVRNEDGSWSFDTEEGIEAIIDRRVGRNELAAIAILEAYVDAQIEYAHLDRDGDDDLEYAQRLASTPGNRDGLYWDAGPDEEPSPFGPLVQGAERYLETKQPGDPIRGYYFQLLSRQGANAPGGAYDYIIDGKMVAGFALVAYPADYGSSGVMTFVVNHRGKILQKDLGPFTGMDAYDPDDSWSEVTPEEG